MTNATKNDLKNALTAKTSKTVKTSKTTARNSKKKTDTSKKALQKSTNAKIANSENLTSEEVAKLQETATDRYKSFSDSFRELVSKNDCIEYVRDSNRDTYFKIDSFLSHISRKEKKIVLYTTTCRDTEERNKILSKFKNTKNIYTCQTTKYINSKKETRLEIIFDNVNTIQCQCDFIDTLIRTVRHCQKLREEFRKEQKKAE